MNSIIQLISKCTQVLDAVYTAAPLASTKTTQGSQNEIIVTHYRDWIGENEGREFNGGWRPASRRLPPHSFKNLWRFSSRSDIYFFYSVSDRFRILRICSTKDVESETSSTAPERFVNPLADGQNYFQGMELFLRATWIQKRKQYINFQQNVFFSKFGPASTT